MDQNLIISHAYSRWIDASVVGWGGPERQPVLGVVAARHPAAYGYAPPYSGSRWGSLLRPDRPTGQPKSAA